MAVHPLTFSLGPYVEALRSTRALLAQAPATEGQSRRGCLASSASFDAFPSAVIDVVHGWLPFHRQVLSKLTESDMERAVCGLDQLMCPFLSKVG